MENNKIDRRVKRTKKQLRLALSKLLDSKPIKDITVREIAELADINRGTFYLHYKDVFDMLEMVEKEMLEEWIALFEPSPILDGKPMFNLNYMYTYLQDNAEMCTVLLGENGDLAFVNRIKDIIKDKWLLGFKTRFNYNMENSQKFHQFYSFVAAGCTGIFEDWLKCGMKETPEYMATLTHTMILNCAKVLDVDVSQVNIY